MRWLSIISAVALGATLVSSMPAVTDAQAQTFPSKPVKVIVPYTPGGTGDVTARGVAQRLTQIWGQPVIVENRPGGSSTIGAEYVARAAPDGYTLLFADGATFVINPHLFSKLNYNALTDFAPITVVFNSPTVLGLSNAVPAKNFRELLAYAKANPGKLSYGSFGNGSYPHVAMEELKQMTGMDLLHVPYKGGAPIITDMIGGRVALTMAAHFLVEPHEKAGKLKIIAAIGDKRLAVRPDLPTIAESGVPGYSVRFWFAMVAPARTPAAILDKINADVVETLRSPEFEEKFLKPQGIEPVGNSREEFNSMLKVEYARWGQLVKSTGVRLA